MKNELTIQHLAPYLPYGLKVIFDSNTLGVLSGIRPNLLTELIVLEALDNNTPIYKNWCILDTKPILRPLSDLTKEIEHNGERFVPGEELRWSNITADIFSKSINITHEHSNLFHCDYVKLTSWHFDVFGLIEKCLAIDINTIHK